MPQKERVSSLKQDIPAVFLALQAEDTPFPAKILALLTVAYALSLIDLVPDFIPVRVRPYGPRCRPVPLHGTKQCQWGCFDPLPSPVLTFSYGML